MDHTLSLTVDGKGLCNCGEGFEETVPSETFELWTAHVEILTLLEEVRDYALQEKASRSAGESSIRKLLDLGLPARRVSNAIGNDENGHLMMSPTLVLRIGRSEHVQTPRRRRKANGTSQK